MRVETLAGVIVLRQHGPTSGDDRVSIALERSLDDDVRVGAVRPTQLDRERGPAERLDAVGQR